MTAAATATPWPLTTGAEDRERYRAAVVEMLVEARELVEDAQRDLDAAQAMPDGRPRAVAVEVAQANRDAHVARVEVLLIAAGLFGIEAPRPPDAPQ
jgi:hypothetical protein